jgi:putative effector of murein hydrolase LrgA (UPF0299 family)
VTSEAPPSPRAARRERAGALAFAAAIAVGVALRLHNALRYPADWGFDAGPNWRYIAQLSHDWSLPDPEAGWSTSDPPLFFYASAAILRACRAFGDAGAALRLVPLAGTLVGLSIPWLAYQIVRDAKPADRLAARLSALLVLFLPAQIHVSAMANEEIWCASLAALALYTAFGGARDEPPSRSRALLAGALAGAAWLAKLSGGVVAAALVASHALRGRRAQGFANALACALAALATGGWFYARNALLHGYLQPHALPVHDLMRAMPPGSRGLADFVAFPLATFGDPQLLNPALLHSVWGSTFATLWFDGHRYFLPLAGDAVRRLGTATLALAVLPTAAFAIGWLRACGAALGSLRASREAPRDAALLLLVPLVLAGYAAFAWRNPSYVVLKGSSLLALALPFGYYASAVLAELARRRRAAAIGIAIAGTALGVCVVAGTSFGVFFARESVPGLPWQEVSVP